MNYNRKIMRLELSAEKALNGGYYYAELLLPAADYEIKDAMQKARAVGRENTVECSILECDILPEMQDIRLDTFSLDELNFLAKRLVSLTDEELPVFYAVTDEVFRAADNDGLVSIKDLINSTYGLDTVPIASGISGPEALGRFAIENGLLSDLDDIPESVIPFLNAEQIGRVQQKNDCGVFEGRLGNVPFQCKHFLGYTKNADGEIEVVPEEAEIIREIYEQYLSGESLHGIKCYLEAKEIPTPAGCSVWRQETIRSILSNEKYKGDAIINKTYVSDCISKRIKANNGERNKYYIENNHPAIIDAGTFARVQEEIARRSSKPKVKQRGTKTELSRYSSKYALSELLICGECRTPYRRCTWTAKGKRKIVWRCINRLDYGKKYCHHSPSIEESLLQDAVMRAIMQTAKQNIEVLKTLKIHIGMGLTDEVTEDKTLDIQIRIAEIDAEFQKMLKAVSANNADGIDEERITELMNEKQRLTVQLEQYASMRQKRESAKSRLDEIYTILDGLQNHPMEYDDKLVRQIIECVVVESKEKIKVVFIGGTEIEMTL